MEIIEKKISEIKPDTNQPRKTFDKEILAGMAETIKTQGIIQPIEIDENNQIVVGERRWRASKLAGIKSIPCIVKSGLTPEQKLERQLIEDIQDEPLPMRERDLAWWKLYELRYSAQAKLLLNGTTVQQGIDNKLREFSRFLGVDVRLVIESFERINFARKSDVDIYQFTPSTVSRTKGMDDDDRIQLLKKSKEKDWTRDKTLKVAEMIKKAPNKVKRIILNTDIEPELIEPVLELKDEKKQIEAIKQIQETQLKPKEIVDFLKDKEPIPRGTVGVGVLSEDQWHSEMSTAFNKIFAGLNSWHHFINKIDKEWADDLMDSAILLHKELQKVIKNGNTNFH
jgi:hypothetical protein